MASLDRIQNDVSGVSGHGRRWPAATRRRGVLRVLGLAAGAGAGFFTGVRPVAAQLEDSSAWALWDRVMTLVADTYYEPVDEAALTGSAMDFLARQRGAAAAKLKPEKIGPDPAACRQAMRNFVLQVSALPGRQLSSFELVESALAQVVEHGLKFSHYFVSRDVEAFAKVDKGQPGLTLERAEDGRFLCLPAEGGPAWKAGIRKGDELVSLEGRAVRGLPLLRAGTLIRGPVDSRVQVQVRQISGRMLSASLRREVAAKGEISLTEAVGSPLLRIPSFGPGTVKELKRVLPQVPAHSTLTIDLQGNSGGDVMAAVEAAGLFLPGTRPLAVAVRTARGQDTTLSAQEPQIVKLRGVTVLMDSGTASASELLILALREGLEVPVTLSGTRSYGKGTFQVQQSLDGGGLLTLTTGKLKTVKGTEWDGKGIESVFGGGR